jgi:hypothetical protein
VRSLRDSVSTLVNRSASPRAPLDQAVELADGTVGDLAGVAPRVGLGAVAIFHGLAAVAPPQETQS